MLSALGFWLSVSFLVLPIPLVSTFFGCILFRDSYRSNLEKMGMSWRESKDRAYQHPLVRWTGWKCFSEDWFVVITIITFVIQMAAYTLASIICLVEGFPYTSSMIKGITVISEVLGPILGYAFIVIVPFTIIPVAGKVAAKVTFFSAKIDKLS